MRFIAWLVGAVFAILVVVFAISNKDSITIGLWPFDEGIQAPKFLIALVPLAIGLLIGAGFSGIGTMRARMRHRSAQRRVRGMEREMEELRNRKPAIAPPESKPQP
jgi:uncharacterized integral membrane protein